MCLITKNYCLKTFVEIRVGEKVWKYVKCCLKTKNCCLKTLNKHHLKVWQRDFWFPSKLLKFCNVKVWSQWPAIWFLESFISMILLQCKEYNWYLESSKSNWPQFTPKARLCLSLLFLANNQRFLGRRLLQFLFIEIVDFIITFYKGFKLIYGSENYFWGCFILLGSDNCDEK